VNTLSIIIPSFNEQDLLTTLKKVVLAPLPPGVSLEIVVVDDGSATDPTDLINEFTKGTQHVHIRVKRHSHNIGKGAAIRTGLDYVTGNIVLIQDADLEYDPSEYTKLLMPILDQRADVVYGSRFRGAAAHRILFFWHSLGNQFLTFLCNMITNLNLTDMETGYKVFRTEILKRVRLRENRFGFEPEVTCKIARIKGIRIYEVGISYYGRQYEEGKKINWKDGLRAIYCLIKYGLLRMK
jgi:glycosyltransferase involved in cell wall biosynthesis